jgi:hypothetical protein
MNSFDNNRIKKGGSSTESDCQVGSQTFEFKYKIPNTDIQLSKRICELENLEKQDVRQWIAEFRTIVKLCEWSDSIPFMY